MAKAERDDSSASSPVRVIAYAPVEKRSWLVRLRWLNAVITGVAALGVVWIYFVGGFSHESEYVWAGVALVEAICVPIWAVLVLFTRRRRYSDWAMLSLGLANGLTLMMMAGATISGFR